jgi:peptidoglycan/xylan/chitin deacetylase (PgdA/CDA1 family)
MFDKRIVTIHAVDDMNYSPYRLELFIKTMRYLGYNFVSISDMLNSKLKKRQIALTFDDCYQSTFTNAIAILKKYKVPALMFIPTGLLGYPANHSILIEHECYKNEATMNIDAINQWIKDGFDIGFHTHEHIDLYETSDERIKEDFTNGMKELTERGWSTPYFAYPKGFLPKNRLMFEELLRQNGFQYAFTINHGSLNIGQPFYINRVCLGNKEPFLWGIIKTIGLIGDWYFRIRKQHYQQIV